MAEYAYDTWGKALSVTGSMAETVEKLNPMRYRGYYCDSETGYYYLQSRYYDPEIGRFINADDITISAILKDSSVGLNLFAYCLNDPINNIDPTGYLVIPRWIVSWIIDALLMAIPFIGFAYAPIKADFFVAVINGVNGDAVAGAAVFRVDDDILGHVHEFAGRCV